MKLIALLAVAIPAFALTDVRVQCTPESLTSTAAVLNIQTMGRWSCDVVSYSDHPVVVTKQMFFQAVPALHRIDTVRAIQVVKNVNDNSTRSRALRGIKLVGPIGLAFTPFAGISKVWIAGIGVSLGLLRDYQASLEAQQPDLAAFIDGQVPQEITLGTFGTSGFSQSFVVYASKMPKPDTIVAAIYFPPTVAPKAELTPDEQKQLVAVMMVGIR